MRLHCPLYLWANDCCPRGSNFLCVTDFPKVKFSASGKFPWIHQSKQKNYPWLFLRYLKRLNQSQELDWNAPKRRNHVLFTCWVRHVANPTRNWTQCSKPNRILSAAVNVFLYFTLNKFKSTLKHWSVFFTCLQELFLTRSFQTCKPELLTSEREFAFLWEKWSHQRLPFQCQNLRLNHSCSA